MSPAQTWVYKNIRLEKELFSVSFWKSLFYLFSMYFIVFSTAILVQSQPMQYKIICVGFNGIIIHHIMTLLHEGAHYLLFPNKKWNDFFSDLFIGLPLFTPLRSYRALHIGHHQLSGSINDPEKAINESQGYAYQKMNALQVIKMFMCDIFFINLIKSSQALGKFLTKEKNIYFLRNLNKTEIAARLLFFPSIIAAIFFLNLWQEVFLYWFLPLTMVSYPLLKQHSYGEHTGDNSSDDFLNTYSHDYNFIESFIFYPINSTCHLEHHLFSGIPWYNLKKARKILLNHSEYKEKCSKNVVDSHFFGKNSVLQRQLLQRKVEL